MHQSLVRVAPATQPRRRTRPCTKSHRQSREPQLRSGCHVRREDVVRVAVEVLAGPIVAHRGARIGVARGDLHVAEADAGVEHGRHEGVAQHVRVHPRDPYPSGGSQVPEPSRRGMPVHPRAEGVAQDRSVGAAVDGAVDRSGHRWWQRDEHDLAALAAHAQYPVAVLFAQIADAGPARFEDPQPEQAEQRDQGEVSGGGGPVDAPRWLGRPELAAVFYRAPIGDGDALAMETHRYRHIYNTIRPHQALGDRVPLQAYLARSAKLINHHAVGRMLSADRIDRERTRRPERDAPGSRSERMMKAVRYSQFGGPEVLEIVDLPDPHPGPGQVRIAVRAAGVNPSDCKKRKGLMDGEPPQTMGHEAAGVVDELGEGVADVAVGDRVFGLSADPAAQAELAVLSYYAPIPPSLDFPGAAALPAAIETATRALDQLGVGAGSTLLINGASGSVGSAAVQLAVAGGPQHVVTIADFGGAQEHGVTFSSGDAGRAVHALAEIGELIESGRFSLPVARTFPLAEIAQAHRVSEDGHVRGKLVLLVG